MPIIVANWKMNLNFQQAIALTGNIINITNVIEVNNKIILCPSFPMLKDIKKLLTNDQISLGAQDCSGHSHGSYTGEVSAEILKDSGCSYVILGHSERRLYHYETCEQVLNKANQALKNALTPIICIGETKEEREKGITKKIIIEHLEKTIPKNFYDKNIIIAYEPRWAIGTKINLNIAEIKEIIKYINNYINSAFSFENKPLILYGGSVSPKNFSEIYAIEGVDGILLGSYSLNIEDFKIILGLNN